MNSVHLPHLRQLLERHAGLDLGRGGMEANLINFIEQRLSINKFPYERYLQLLETPASEELRLLLEAMTVVYTWFFRDPGQFNVLEQLIQRFPSERTMGIWVAGCGTGEEPFSVALVAASLGKQVDILATDLNSEALRHAQIGRYTSASLAPVDAGMRDRYLGNSPNDFVVPDAVKQLVRFKIGNLVDAPPKAPSSEGWDLVICRNVLIYFGREQSRRTLNALANSLAPGGFLVLGASEAILERPSALSVVGVGGRAVLERPHYLDERPSKSLIVMTNPPTETGPQVSPFVATNSPVSPTRAILTSRSNRALGMALSPTLTAENSTGKLPAAKRMNATLKVALEQGHAALEAGNIPEARESYEQAVHLDATCSEASMFAGIAHYLDGDLMAALRHLRSALCLDATLWVACFYQALCYENMGYAEDAAHSYSMVLKLAGGKDECPNSHYFLKGWRNDLLAVARKRAHPGKINRTPSSQQIRVKTVGSSIAESSIDRSAERRSKLRTAEHLRPGLRR